ncbi:hypothetical protein SAMN05661096_01876 [Marivirga sericea]|uniref:Uncharacterized protein n=1 Tax=Marivirga sericea TaxID=1028 RepID=A0A1X7JNR4_9BACT|nr:hypothetical protein SAMN05661096_01876 [Marivirga sericea]
MNRGTTKRVNKAFFKGGCMATLSFWTEVFYKNKLTSVRNLVVLDKLNFLKG